MAQIVHPFYDTFRVAFLGASATLAFAFAFQNYVDRRSVRKLLFESPRTFTTYRVFRIGIFFGALFHTVVGIDFFGAHGIYAPYTRVTLLALASIWIGVVFPFSIVNELKVAFKLKTFGDRTQKFVKYVGASTVPWCMFIMVTMKYIDSRTYYIFARVMLSCSLIALSCVQAYVYFTIQRHQQTMQKMEISLAKDFLQDLIKQWRKYIIISTIIVFVIIGSYIEERLNPLTAAMRRDNVNFSVDYATTPTVGQIIASVSNLFVLMVLGWRAWLGKEQRAHLADELSSERPELNASAPSADVAAVGIKGVVGMNTHVHVHIKSDSDVRSNKAQPPSEHLSGVDIDVQEGSSYDRPEEDRLES